MSMKIVEFRREDWRDAAKTLRKIAENLDAGVHPECTVGALTLIGPKGEVTVFGLGPKCDDLQCLGAMRLGEQKLIDVLLDSDLPYPLSAFAECADEIPTPRNSHGRQATRLGAH